MAEQAKKKPKLESCLEAMEGQVALLREESNLFQHMKQVLQQAEAGDGNINMDGVGMKLSLGTIDVPLPVPTDPNAVMAHVEDAVAFLGEAVITRWQAIAQIAKDANEHCAAAAAAVEPQPEGG